VPGGWLNAAADIVRTADIVRMPQDPGKWRTRRVPGIGCSWSRKSSRSETAAGAGRCQLQLAARPL